MKVSKEHLVLAVFFLLAFSVSLYASVAYLKPVGADIVFHLEIVDVYLRGENGMFAPHVMEVNRIPYPPLFHMMLLPSVALGVGNAFLLFLQTLLYPVCLLLAMRIVQVYGYGIKHSIIVAVSLLGSLAYLDAVFQIRPESLDMVLWLLVLYGVLSSKPKLVTVSAILGVYNHSFPSLAQNGGILLKKWNTKRNLIIVLASLPIFIISLIYLAPMLGKWVGTPASNQARSFMQNFLGFTFVYLGGLLVGIPIALYDVFKWKSLNQLSKFCLLTVASSLLLVPVWYDRYYQYISIPLAVLIGDFMLTYKGKNRLVVVAYIAVYIAVFFVQNYFNLWQSNFIGLWDIH